MPLKADLTGKSKDKVAAKRRKKSLKGHACKGAAWMELHAVLLLAGHLRKTRIRLIGPPLLASKRRRACSSFDNRHNVSSKKRSAGTQVVACQAL